MPFLKSVYFGNAIQSWLFALGAAVLSLMVLIIIRKIMIRKLSAISGSERQTYDILLNIISDTKYSFLFFFALYIGSDFLVLTSDIHKTWNEIFFVVWVIQMAIWIGSGISRLISVHVKKCMEDDVASTTTVSVLGFISKLLLWSIALLLILDNMGINIASLIAGLGIGGIAVALAVQNILGDLFGSLSIIIDKPFVVGDFIVVDQLRGNVEKIGLRTTRLRSLGGEQLIFSNNDLLKSRIQNFKRMVERRIIFRFGVVYQTPPEKLVLINSIIREIIGKQEKVRFDRVHFKEYGDSSLNFEVVYFVKNQDYNFYMDIQQTINLEIFSRFRQENIEFAYPTRTVFVQSDTDGRDVV